MNIVMVGLLGVFIGACGGFVLTILMVASSSTSKCEECVVGFSGHKKDERREACSQFVSDYVVELSKLETLKNLTVTDCKILAFDLLEETYPKEDKVESLKTQ